MAAGGPDPSRNVPGSGEEARKPGSLPRQPRPIRGTTAEVVREADKMRSGIEADLRELAMDRLLLRMAVGLGVDEHVKVRLVNRVQHCEKDVRGVVRALGDDPRGGSAVEIELFTRLTPLEVSMLKMGIPPDDGPADRKWV